MKNTKFYGMLMLALLVVQSGVQAKQDDNKHPKKQRTWREAAYENRYNIAVGAGAAVALGALGWVYGDNIKDWYNSLSPEEQVKAQEIIQEDAKEKTEIIEEKVDKVEAMTEGNKHSAAHNKEVAKEQKEIMNLEKQVAQEEGFLTWAYNLPGRIFFSPEIVEERSQYAAKVNAERAARDAEDNGDYRSSDMRTDSEREAYKRDHARAKRIDENRFQHQQRLQDEDALGTPSEGYDLGKVGSDVASGLSSAYNSARDAVSSKINSFDNYMRDAQVSTGRDLEDAIADSINKQATKYAIMKDEDL